MTACDRRTPSVLRTMASHLHARHTQRNTQETELASWQSWWWDCLASATIIISKVTCNQSRFDDILETSIWPSIMAITNRNTFGHTNRTTMRCAAISFGPDLVALSRLSLRARKRKPQSRKINKTNLTWNGCIQIRMRKCYVYQSLMGITLIKMSIVPSAKQIVQVKVRAKILTLESNRH